MQSAKNSLDDLQGSSQPAWLWDGVRARVVWANSAGIEMFGGDTLFDLIDQSFDMRNPHIARIAELCKSLQRGTSQQESLSLPTARGDLTIECDCQIHSLPDGRNGLLMVSHRTGVQASASPLMTGVLAAMPMAIIVVDGAGDTIFSNQAAADILAPERLQRLAALLESGDDAADLIRHTLEAGTITTVRKVETHHGLRELRIISRSLEDAGEETGDQILLMLEDVTERRALERTLATEGKYPGLPPSQPEAEMKRTDAPASAEPPVETPAGDKAALAEIARSISSETPESGSPARQINLPKLPLAIAGLLESSPEPVILHRNNAVYYANPAALRFLGYADFTALVNYSGIGPRLREFSAPDHLLEATTSDGQSRAIVARTSKFPWHDGVMWQSKLRVNENAQPEAGSLEPKSEPEPTPQLQPPGEADTAMPASPEMVDDSAKPARAETAAPFGSGDPELRSIVDTAADGLVMLNMAGEIVNLSAGAEALFGFRLAEVMGKPFADLLHEESQPVLKAYLASLSESGVASIFNDGREVTGIVSQGGEISLFMTINKLHSGTQASYCAVLRDITQWKKTERELRDAVKTAEAESAQKSEFLARISHELRTPLNAILGFSDVMRSERFGEVGNPQYLGYANDIHQSGSHLLSLINDLLDLSKVEAGKAELNFVSVDLAATTAECIRLLQNEATAARVVIRQNLSPDLPNVVADQRSMKQIILNLLSNSVKFTDPGGQVIISAKLNAAGELVYKVKDTGIGMGEDELKQALEPFARISVTERRERQGTGLGLPLTRALAQANRARFRISSEPRKGTLVEITFPTTRVLAD